MGQKLVGKDGECLCIECRKKVDPESKRCEECGMVFEGMVDGKLCNDCGSLVRIDLERCSICDSTSFVGTKETKPVESQIKLNKADEEFLTSVLTWTTKVAGREVDSEEDQKEREHAVNVLKAVATIEPDEEIEKEFVKLGETAKKKEQIEGRRKQLIELGKPFETVIMKSMESIEEIKEKITEKEGELRQIADQKGRKKKKDVKKEEEIILEIEDLSAKKETLESKEKNILQIGSAYSILLDKQQESLSDVEADLRKRIQAFQKEVERRKKMTKALKDRTMALDEREEELSKRFLDLKRRENELVINEQRVEKILSDPKISPLGIEDGNPDENKELMVTTSVEKEEKETKLKEQESEINQLKDKIEELDNLIKGKDDEIKSLRDEKTEGEVDDDTKKILKILDELLEKLPEEVVDSFARSDDFSLYEKVLEKYGI